MKKLKKLEWKYCECGCHQFEAGNELVSFSIFWDMKDGPQSHRLAQPSHSYKWTYFPTWEEATAHAQKIYEEKMQEFIKKNTGK